MNPWYKLILFLFVVVGPAIIVGVSNYTAFPDSFGLATVMLIVTAGVSGVFTWKSNDATPKIVRYCIVADVIICAILCVNMASHWILSREISGAKQSTVERHTEEDREEKRKSAEAERQIALKKADAEIAQGNAKALNAEANRLAKLPRWMRTSEAPVVAPVAAPSPVIATFEANPTPEAKAGKPKATEEEVRERWWWWLISLAIAECFASVLAGAVLIGVWEWDRNHDGINDALQQPVKLPVKVPITVIESDFPDVLPTGKLPEVVDPKALRR